MNFIIRSVVLGLIIALMILALVPGLRYDSGIGFNWFSDEDTTPAKLSYYQAVSQAAPAVVNIYSLSTENRNGLFRSQSLERTSLGSGVIMTENGHILTCLHVIQNADSILVGLQDSRMLEAQMVGVDPFTDLAVLKVNADNLHVIPQLQDTQTRVGDVVMAIGNPFNLGQTITQGIVSRTGRNGLANYVDFIQMDAVLHQGNSGGALVDSNGFLIGITNANFKTLDARRRLRDVDGVNFAVPYELAKRVMDEIIVNGKVIRGQLGFRGGDLIGGPGILITDVASNGPAERAGIRPNDILISVNGAQVENAAKTLDLVAETEPGTVLQLEVSRGEQLLTIPVTVAELSIAG
ncbi:trypsin-like peptidase domain-containing protein [Aestuariibacter salexigens]|uniref:trypsin-like peptidase domain-containing protein n=1 Tax=Aestuariibacter salexigens TaxID=226010 RepID=UPI0004038AA9|nr:trypsin-like peptidase domain-containing protein [Aestuariibacter salexigens]